MATGARSLAVAGSISAVGGVALLSSSSGGGGSSSSTHCAGSPQYTLRYFPVPGAPGEVIRLLLVLSEGEGNWKDEVTGMKSSPPWKEVKPTTKWGQMPVLYTADGKEMTQSRAIARFLAAKMAVPGGGASGSFFGGPPKLLPADNPELCFQADEIVEALEDVRYKIVKTFAIKDQAEKEAARAALFVPGGDIYEGFKKIDAVIAANGSGGGFSVGSAFSLADFWAFVCVNQFRAGFLDGVPKDGAWLEDMPQLKAVVENVAAIPALKSYYAGKAAASKLYAPFVAK